MGRQRRGRPQARDKYEYIYDSIYSLTYVFLSMCPGLASRHVNDRSIYWDYGGATSY